MREKAKEIKKALHYLGYKAGSAIKVEFLDRDRAIITCRDTVIGIYDFIKHTFID